MVKNSKRWIPSRESREKDVRAAIALGMFFSLLKFFGFLNKCLTVFYSKKIFNSLSKKQNQLPYIIVKLFLYDSKSYFV